MIATSLILGAALLIGAGLVIKFWNNIISYLKKVIEKITMAIKAAVLWTRVCLRKTSDGIIQITRSYSENTETKKWKETVVRRVIDENEIPKEIRSRLTMDEEFDITDELELKLQGA